MLFGVFGLVAFVVLIGSVLVCVWLFALCCFYLSGCACVCLVDALFGRRCLSRG